MNLLVATNQTQGTRPNDFCWVPEGELVYEPVVGCTGEGVDGPCGCRRAMAGVVTPRATTTIRVADLETDRQAYARAVRAGLERQRWIPVPAPEDVERWLAKEIEWLLTVAGRFEVRTVLERRGNSFEVRAAPVAR